MEISQIRDRVFSPTLAKYEWDEYVNWKLENTQFIMIIK